MLPPPNHQQPLIFFLFPLIILAKLEFKFFPEIFNKGARNHFMWFVSENPDKTWSISKVLIIIHLKAIFPRAAVWLEISVVIPHLVCSCESTPTTRLDHGAGPSLSLVRRGGYHRTWSLYVSRLGRDIWEQTYCQCWLYLHHEIFYNNEALPVQE